MAEVSLWYNPQMNVTWSYGRKFSVGCKVIAWCRRATSHYLNQYWPRSISPCDVTRPQWVKGAVLITHLGMFSPRRQRIYKNWSAKFTLIVQERRILSRIISWSKGVCLNQRNFWRVFFFHSSNALKLTDACSHPHPVLRGLRYQSSCMINGSLSYEEGLQLPEKL